MDLESARDWKEDLREFFDLRSEEVSRGRLSLEQLCYVSGRESRLWADETLYNDLIDSIEDQLGLRRVHVMLEVGCAAGFLAWGLASRVGRYVGLDLSREAMRLARSLKLPEARFVQGDGIQLPFADGVFDRVVSYDVFTNIPEWTVAARMVREMVRVVKPGARVMIGSLASDNRKDELPRFIERVTRELDRKYGPVAPPVKPSFWNKWMRRRTDANPRVTCYYFRPHEFIEEGRRLGVETAIQPIHSRNPYRDFRFNVIYIRPDEDSRV